MENIVMCRVDFRLIHGQVITKWLRYYPAKKIVIVDNLLSEDDFMAEIYKMAVPQGLILEIMNEQEAESYLTRTKESIFLLFKDIATAYRFIKKGYLLKRLVVGGVPSEVGRKLVFSGVYLDQVDFEKLMEIERDGIEVTFSSTPDDKSLKLKSIKELF
ncbi:PTS sugar transporter subunit IIB [Enterococcus avium]|uniref:PTS sugar transporter subunit IIB n=1 Tax=Enterococcus avium TaxID=33945 RepID=UPI00159E68CA|nr:PTS sugar transporter subunit IIB [Enterococcus avium]NVN75893.1 PTS mannose/fructose/sorbose transporter subunit IIB [Enterococcus avium]